MGGGSIFIFRAMTKWTENVCTHLYSLKSNLYLKFKFTVVHTAKGLSLQTKPFLSTGVIKG